MIIDHDDDDDDDAAAHGPRPENLAIVPTALNLNIAQFPPLANFSLSWQPPTFDILCKFCTSPTSRSCKDHSPFPFTVHKKMIIMMMMMLMMSC